MKSISIIHPSRNRPEMAANTARKWLACAKDAGRIEYILSLDYDDGMKEDYRKAFRTMPGVVFHFFGNRSAIDAINVAAEISTANLLVIVSDDFDCPMNWDEMLLIALEKESDFIVKTKDGCQPWIITLPIMDRAYYNRFGYIYYPEYSHMFCDTEMSHVADLLGRKIELDIVFAHHHYTTGKTKQDAINDKNNATWGQGEQLYLERLKRNFDLKEFSGKLSCAKHHIHWLQQKGITV